MEFAKLSAPSLKDLFVQQLQGMILSDELPMGTQLPPERELAQQMQVSRAVVNGGLAELAQQEQNAEVRDQVLALEQEREFTADNLYLIGEADIAAWQKAAAAMVIPEENFYTQEIMELRDRLLQGNLSLDGFLDQCSQHMEMIYAARGE